MNDKSPTSTASDPIPTLGQVIPAIAKSVYSDAVSGVLQEAGKISVDVMKTFRLALFPLQYTSALQDRLSNYIQTAIAAVPEARRTEPRESLVLSISEKLRFHDESDPLTKLYVNLLSRALDSERLGEAHPAFVNIIAQLAPDEALCIDLLGRAHKVGSARLSPKAYLIVRDLKDRSSFLLTPALIAKVRSTPGVMHALSTHQLEEAVLPIERLAQPDLFSTFLEHLVALGLVTFDNEAKDATMKVASSINVGLDMLGVEFFSIRLNEFGRLFFRACVKNEA
jgi:Abortive infection alpha